MTLSGPLAGAPFAVKNLFDVEELRRSTANGGRRRRMRRSSGRLKNAGDPAGWARGQKITSGELFEHSAAKLLREGDGFLLRVEINPATGRLLVLVKNLKPARSVSLVVEPYPHPVHSFRQSRCGDHDFHDVNHGLVSSARISHGRESGATPGEPSPT